MYTIKELSKIQSCQQISFQETIGFLKFFKKLLLLSINQEPLNFIIYVFKRPYDVTSYVITVTIYWFNLF